VQDGGNLHLWPDCMLKQMEVHVRGDTFGKYC
jgi:hypothetical protein